MTHDRLDQIRGYADLLARHPTGTVPVADVLWKLRHILANPAGVPDAPVGYGAPVRLRETWMCGAFQPPAQHQRAQYRCTEPYDHGGEWHRAQIDGETVAAWPRQTNTGGEP